MQLPTIDNDMMRLTGFHHGQDLSSYLSQLRKVVYSSEPKPCPVTVILGNPSCDLDSFICAFVLSYFYNSKPNAAKHHRHPIYVPVLNLPDVRKDDLWRQRPEFAVAMRGAFDGLSPQAQEPRTAQAVQQQQAKDKSLLEQLFTIHELANSDEIIASLRDAFQPSRSPNKSDTEHEKVDVILVDHNAPAIETINNNDIQKRFQVVGCIDHHVEEDYVPKDAVPRIVRLGIGSCMSLVTEHLRKQGLWTLGQPCTVENGFRQASCLALAPVLIDTWNLKAPGDKCSDLDREQAAFLRSQMGDAFDPEDLFQQLQTAKTESVNLLRTQEIFARDYKSYVETSGHKQELNVGITSIVQDLAWLSAHAGGKKDLVHEIRAYARDNEKVLDVFSMLTRSGARKQLCIFAFDDHCAKAIDTFEHNASELGLQTWEDDDELCQLLDEIIGARRWKIWWMGDTSKSRKQVAPLLRSALKQISTAN